jgi:hypothetical protein
MIGGMIFTESARGLTGRDRSRSQVAKPVDLIISAVRHTGLDG